MRSSPPPADSPSVPKGTVVQDVQVHTEEVEGSQPQMGCNAATEASTTTTSPVEAATAGVSTKTDDCQTFEQFLLHRSMSADEFDIQEQAQQDQLLSDFLLSVSASSHDVLSDANIGSVLSLATAGMENLNKSLVAIAVITIRNKLSKLATDHSELSAYTGLAQGSRTQWNGITLVPNGKKSLKISRPISLVHLVAFWKLLFFRWTSWLAL